VSTLLLLLSLFLLVVFINPINQNITGNAAGPQANVKIFNINSEDFRFTINGLKNPELTVNKNDKVTINIYNKAGNHNFVLSGFNSETKVLGPGETSKIEFIADKPGTYQYFSDYRNDKEKMNGLFIVKG